MKRNLACPACGDDSFWRSMFKRAPGWVIPCPNCLEFVAITPELTLRKATQEERLIMMTHPETREIVEAFAARAKEFRRVRDELMRYR